MIEKNATHVVNSKNKNNNITARNNFENLISNMQNTVIYNLMIFYI